MTIELCVTKLLVFPVDPGYINSVVVMPGRAEEVDQSCEVDRDEEDKEAEVLDVLRETNPCLHQKPVQLAD